MILQPRYPKTRMASRRRAHLKKWVKFNALQCFKIRIKYGRRKNIHWWRT